MSRNFVKQARVVLFLWLFYNPAAGQVPASPTPSKDPLALSLLEQCSAAMGSTTLADMNAQGTVTPANPKNPTLSISVKSKGGKVRNTVSGSSGEETYVVNGLRAWSLRGTKQTFLPRHVAAYSRPSFVPALLCVLDANRPNMSIGFVGVEQIRGRAAHHLKFNVPSAATDDKEPLISEFHVFLDQKDLTVVATRGFIFAPNAMENYSLWETYYSDYRRISGSMVPAHVEQYVAGQKLQDVTFTTISINTGIADSEFE